MRADKFLAGVAYSDCPALLFKMVFCRMESIPTNDLIVILMGVFITCSIHISSAAKASVVKAIAKSTVNTNTKSARQQALDDAVSSAIFEAVLERFTEQQVSSDATNSAIFDAILDRIVQLEAQRITPPPASPRLTLSAISALNTSPELPTKLQPLSISSILAQSSVPVGARLVNLSLSDIMIIGQSVPIMAPPESYVMKWHSGDPRAIIKTLEAITHGLLMQDFKLNASVQVNGTYVAGELYRRKQQVEDLQTHYRSMCIQHVIDKASVAKQNADIEAFARKVIDLNVQIATLTVLAEKAWASEDVLKNQVVTVGAQLSEVSISESALKDQVANSEDQLDEARKKVTSIEEELDDARMSNFMLQDEADGTNELLGETTALYNKVGNMERELRDCRNSEQVLQQEVNEYAAIIRTIQNAGIYIEKYHILANVEVTPIVDEITRSFGAGLDAAAAADTTTFTSLSEAKSTSLPAIEFEPVINTAQNTLNPFASPFSFDTTSTFSPAVAIEVESLVTTPLVTEITTLVRSGLGDSQYAAAPASESSPAIEPKSPVTKITTPIKGGLGASKFAPEMKSNASLASAVAIKPAASEATTLSGLGSSKYAAAPASNSSPAVTAKTTTTAKVTTPRLGGLTVSKYSDVRPASPVPPASNQTPAKNAVVNQPGSSWIQPPGLGEGINLEDYQEKLHCIVCTKKVTIEFQFDYGKKFYLWELHQRDFHSKCPDCHKTVPAIWDDKSNGHDFSEHHKVCAVLPAGWAICKFCHEKTPAPLISTPEGRIRDFSKHNITCPVKAEEKTVLFHCKNCGIGVTNKSDFYDDHSKPCFERACVNHTVDAFDEKTGARKPPTTHFHCKNCGMGVTDKSDFFKNHKKSCDAKASANGMWYVYDGNTGTFVGPQPAMATQTTTPKTATPHATMANFGKQPASATTSSRTPPTGQRGGKAPASERRPALPLFGGRGSHSPTTPQVTASPWW
jgi:hypothetical protein